MELNDFKNIDFDDPKKQLSVKVLSNHDNFYAIWIEKDKLVMELHYSIKEKQIKLLSGELGNAIYNLNLNEEQKINRCSDAINNALFSYYNKNEDSKITSFKR